ncbi:hypothetical protein BD410DRAFT_791232 [Rickenella mellea]|uniref:F-box domain-containing protein n=1 Tax=Rickenella mellea TaxID=50990 RepID=A0A4Y7PYR0_9AGAM|nr:hypothetical protein BD410DRAFT_791232 [Rickenella mellea]
MNSRRKQAGAQSLPPNKTSYLPPEIWRDIITFCTHVPGALADDVREDIQPLTFLNSEDWEPELHTIERYAINESMRTKLSLSLVSRGFHSIAIESFYEILPIRGPRQLFLLAKQPRETPSLAERIGKWTRRFEFGINIPDVGRMCIDPERDRLCTIAIRDVVRCCRDLTHFFIDVAGLCWIGADCVLGACRSNCHTVKVLRWGVSVSGVVETSDVLHAFPNIREFQFRYCDLLSGPLLCTEYPSMTNLHTLDGGLQDVTSTFADASLPALSVVRFRRDPPHVSDFELTEGTTIERFLSNHRNTIRSITAITLYRLIEFEVACCAQIKELITGVDDLLEFGVKAPQPFVARLGLSVSSTDLLMQGIDTLMEIFKEYFPNLQFLRIVEKAAFVVLCMKYPHALRYWARRLQSVGITLEEPTGKTINTLPNNNVP